jgi:hypothetical protein
MSLVPFRQAEEIEKLFGVALSGGKRDALTKMLSDWQDDRVRIELGWTLDAIKEIQEQSANLIREINGGRTS